MFLLDDAAAREISQCPSDRNPPTFSENKWFCERSWIYRLQPFPTTCYCSQFFSVWYNCAFSSWFDYGNSAIRIYGSWRLPVIHANSALSNCFFWFWCEFIILPWCWWYMRKMVPCTSEDTCIHETVCTINWLVYRLVPSPYFLGPRLLMKPTLILAYKLMLLIVEWKLQTWITRVISKVTISELNPCEPHSFASNSGPTGSDIRLYQDHTITERSHTWKTSSLLPLNDSSLLMSDNVFFAVVCSKPLPHSAKSAFKSSISWGPWTEEFRGRWWIQRPMRKRPSATPFGTNERFYCCTRNSQKVCCFFKACTKVRLMVSQANAA